MVGGELGDPERWADGVMMPGGLGVVAAGGLGVVAAGGLGVVAAGGLALGVEAGVDPTDSSSSDFSEAVPSEVHT